MNRVLKGSTALLLFWQGGTGLSFVALRDNICAVASKFKFAFEKARNGPFINGLTVRIYERSV